MIVSVFKTNIRDSDLALISTILDKIHAIRRWNTDLDDCDNILRIESLEEIIDIIINILYEKGFQIIELKD